MTYMPIARCWVATALLLGAAAAAGPIQAQENAGASRVFGDLLRRIPEKSNALLLIDVDGLFDSPMGRREDWRAKARDNREAFGGLPSGTARAAVALSMDFAGGQERWRIGMARMSGPTPDLEALAAREGGYVETIADTPVVWTPRGFELFRFNDGILGFVAPANRQGVADWIRTTLSKPRTFPPGFASRAIFRADAGAQVALALDLADTVSPRAVEPWLRGIDEIRSTHTDPKLLAARLATVKSAFLTIRVDQAIEGGLRIDFGQQVDHTAPVARALILNLLDDFGAELPELRTWNLRFDRNVPAVEMSGRLSVESLRRVISLANPPRFSDGLGQTPPAVALRNQPGTPAPAPAAEPAPAPRSGPSRNDTLAASQSYYRAVTSLISGLKGTQRPTYRSLRLWYARYAKQIEELPILGVDSELLDWGFGVAKTFRDMASGINDRVQRVNYDAASTGGGFGGFGGFDGTDRGMDQALIKRRSDAMLSIDLDQGWQGLETSSAEMRRKMVQKYQVDF